MARRTVKGSPAGEFSMRAKRNRIHVSWRRRNSMRWAAIASIERAGAGVAMRQ
jgi:hypothetical protein